MNNVVEHESKMWNDANRAKDKYKRSKVDVRVSALEYGFILLNLRERYGKDDRRFAVACAEHGHDDITNDERADLIWLARIDEDARNSLFDFFPNALSVRSLRKALRESDLPNDFGEPSHVPHQCGTSENISETIETPVEKAEMEETISRSTDNSDHVTPSVARDKLFEVFPKDKDSIKKAYSSAGGGNPGWKEEFIDIANRISDYTGLSPSKFGNDFGPHAIFHNIGKWAFLNSMRGKFNKTTVENILDNWKHLVDLDEELELSDDKSAKFANEWWKNNVMDNGYDPDAAARIIQLTQQYVEDSSKPRESKFTRVMGTVRPIIAYGVTIWDESSDIDKDVAFNVYQFWSSIDSMVRKADTSPSSRGRSYQGDTTYLRPLTNNQAASVWYKIATAMIDHPDKESECSAPSEFVVS